jgi:ferrochelatase
MKKTGVLLIQLGTPDSPRVSDVRSYLSEFLNDPRVIDIPFLLRAILVNGIIVPFRAPKSAKVYKELWELGEGQSPLLTHSLKLQSLLQDAFKDQDVTFELAMRYKNPSLDTVLERMRKANYERIIILPLFPQYASASSGSAIEKAMNIIRKWWVIPEIKIISQFYENEGYLGSIVENAKQFTSCFLTTGCLSAKSIKSTMALISAKTNPVKQPSTTTTSFAIKRHVTQQPALSPSVLAFMKTNTPFVFNPD